MIIVKMWIGFAMAGVTLFSAAFLWGVRARQFTDLDRARYLALKAVEPVEPDPQKRKCSVIDRLGLLGVVLVTLILFALVLWVGYRCLNHGACNAGVS